MGVQGEVEWCCEAWWILEGKDGWGELKGFDGRVEEVDMEEDGWRNGGGGGGCCDTPGGGEE